MPISDKTQALITVGGLVIIGGAIFAPGLDPATRASAFGVGAALITGKELLGAKTQPAPTPSG